MGTQTFVMIKPDAMRRGLAPNIRNMITDSGFSIVRASIVFLSEEKVRELYQAHMHEIFFEDLVNELKGNNVICASLHKDSNCVESFRELVGNTDPSLAAENTIRGRFGVSKSQNSVHASDSDESAVREIELMLGLD